MTTATKKKEKFKGSRAHQIYKLSDGTRVPGTTTITGLLDKSGPLMHWAWNLGMQGVDYKKFRDKSAEAGTLGHEMIQEYLGGPEVDYAAYSKDLLDKAENSLLSFYAWELGKELKTISIEEKLVSESYRYGGAIDWYGAINGRWTLMDLKTSKGVYEGHKIQLSAYNNLLLENGYKVEQVLCLRVGRDETDWFDCVEVQPSEMSIYWEMFKHLREVYELRKKVK